MNLLTRMAKTFWISLWAAFATVALFLPITLSALLSSTGNLAFTLSRVWAWIMLKMTWVHPEIRGKEKIRKGKSYIIVANHQSDYDILSLVTKLGIQFRWIIKKELLKVPCSDMPSIQQGMYLLKDRTENKPSKASGKG